MTITALAREIAIKSVEDTRSSLAYCASGLMTLLIGGLVTLFCVIAVGIPILLGYLHSCLTGVMAGDEALPRFGKSPGLLKNGLRVAAIGLVYVVVIVLPFLALLIIEIFTLPWLIHCCIPFFDHTTKPVSSFSMSWHCYMHKPER